MILLGSTRRKRTAFPTCPCPKRNVGWKWTGSQASFSEKGRAWTCHGKERKSDETNESNLVLRGIDPLDLPFGFAVVCAMRPSGRSGDSMGSSHRVFHGVLRFGEKDRRRKRVSGSSAKVHDQDVLRIDIERRCGGHRPCRTTEDRIVGMERHGIVFNEAQSCRESEAFEKQL